MTDYGRILEALSAGEVQYIIVGGVAAVIHGSARLTLDVDIVYRRTRENITRLVETLRPYSPYPRGAPPGLPFVWDEQTVRNGLNFTLTTTLGDLDILGEIIGGGDYDALLPHSAGHEAFGVRCACLDLDALIASKRAAGRPKDYEGIAELESIREERDASA